MTIANNDENESSYIINLSGTGTIEGNELADDFATAGATIISDSYLAPRDSGDASLTVGGDITIQAGVTLTIYEGVTLDMDDYRIVVDGNLVVNGSDDQRVKLTGSQWGGILVNGTADINGAVLDELYSSSGYAINASGGDFTLTNSRIHHPGTSVGVRISSPEGGATFTIENNIICDTSEGSSNQSAVDMYAFSVTPAVTVNIRYNTFMGKGTSGYTIYMRNTESSIYSIEKNIFANGTSAPPYSAGIFVVSSTPLVSVVHNIFDDRGSYDFLDGVAVDTDTENLEFASWDNSIIFDNYDLNEFTMNQTTTYPSLAAAGNVEELEGSLTNGNVNEIGAYGNGGYPPLWND